jgi:hypothetical protein
MMTDQQKKDRKNRYKARTFLLNSIWYTKHEKLTNRGTAKAIFDSIRTTHEGNELVKQT